MDRAQAVEALELLRRVVGQARDDTTLQNWGAIWMLHGVTNALGFIATNVLVWRGHETPWPYAGLWTAILAFNIGSIFLLKAQPAGAWTFFESMIWLIWMTFIGAVALTGLVNHLGGFRVMQLGPVIAVLSAAAFSMMGGMMGKRWFLGTALFGATALAMAVFPRWQFVMLGLVWGVTQFGAGTMLHRQRKRRLAAGAPARLV
jgi:hypothetical protein